MKKELNIGGQAVIEGVMMKSPCFVAVAVRKPNKKIKVEEIIHDPLAKRYKFLGWPMFRGILALIEMLVLGIKALTFSANESIEQEGEEKEELSAWSIIITIFLSLLFGVVLFVIIPYAITTLVGFHEDKNSVLFNLVDGILKIIIFVSYVALIGMMRDIKRVFQYHGAEHKVVNCYEAGKKLNVRNCRKYSTINPRCGTSFILFVILLGIIVFSLTPLVVDTLWPGVENLSFIWKKAVMVSIRILFLFPLAAISYEFLKMTARYCNNWLVKIAIAPGLLVQKLTTREPTDDMVEVAIKAMKNVLKKEKKRRKEEVTLT